MTDEIQLLRDFRSDIPAPDEETVRRAYRYATRQPRAARRLRLHAPRSNQGRILAVAAATAAVALVGFLATPGRTRNPISSTGVAGGAVGSAGVALANPFALNDAPSALGAPLFLPYTPLLKPADAASTAYEQWCASASPGAPAQVCQVTVNFPAQSVQIVYSVAAKQWPPQYQNYVTDPLAFYQSEMQTSTNPDKQIVYLNGIPAFLARTKDPNSAGSFIQFRLAEYAVIVFAQNYDPTQTQELAQSMVDQASSASP
jgi:hypothetical protein